MRCLPSLPLATEKLETKRLGMLQPRRSALPCCDQQSELHCLCRRNYHVFSASSLRQKYKIRPRLNFNVRLNFRFKQDFVRLGFDLLLIFVLMKFLK